MPREYFPTCSTLLKVFQQLKLFKFLFQTLLYTCKLILHCHRRAMVTRCNFFSTGGRQRINVFFISYVTTTLAIAEKPRDSSLESDRNSVSVSVTAPKLAIFLVSLMAVIVKHGFGLLSITAETTTRFRREPKLSLLAPPQLCC